MTILIINWSGNGWAGSVMVEGMHRDEVDGLVLPLLFVISALIMNSYSYGISGTKPYIQAFISFSMSSDPMKTFPSPLRE